LALVGAWFVFHYFDSFDFHVHYWAVVGTGWGCRDFVNGFHPFENLAENGVIAVEKVRSVFRENYEKLAAVGVWAGVGHGDSAADVMKVWVDFVIDCCARPFVAVAAGAVELCEVTALDHEVGDYPVKDCPVVFSVLREGCEIFYHFRGLIWEKFDLYRPVLSEKNRYLITFFWHICLVKFTAGWKEKNGCGENCDEGWEKKFFHRDLVMERGYFNGWCGLFQERSRHNE